ncbi:MAG: stage V sporulation protein S [Oscillochloris sp.]|nr:stage V sporulation protein S [Oscillochloris sp.]
MTTVEEAQGGLARERIIEDAPQLISQQDTILKVAARSRPTATAGAIAGVVRSGGSALIQAVGAGAVNQAVKAVAIAQMYLSAEGLDIVCVPFFLDVAIEEQERTAVCLRIELRSSIAS